MSTKNQSLDVVRNIVVELDKEIKSTTGTIEFIETTTEYDVDMKVMLLSDWNSHLRTLKNLRDFVIYKA
jgi:hypothetical protein